MANTIASSHATRTEETHTSPGEPSRWASSVSSSPTSQMQHRLARALPDARHLATFNVQMPGLSPPPLGGKLSASQLGGQGAEKWGIPSRRARGHGPEVSHGVDHEVPVSSDARGCRGAGSRADPSDLRGAGSNHHPGGGLAGSYPHVGGGAAADLAVEAGAVHQGAVVAAAATRVPSLAETLLGAASVGPGVFLRECSAVDEATIRAYIENQQWDEDVEGFKITGPREP